MTEINNKYFHCASDNQKTYKLLAEKVTIIVSGEQTNGEYSLTHIIEPPKAGPPLHIHNDDDESFYILKGDVCFYIGDEIINASAGDYVFAPKGIPHRFLAGSEEAELIVRSTPANFDALVKEFGIPVLRDAKLSQVKEFSSEYIKNLVHASKAFNITYPDLKL
ncbi:cupin domain-containing protein [Staphylococcus shinii]|jgi:quercetin dioxygenase-like cupin family protein|uniref:cupin domain-containing protein n=1 Tax=Staphylococcus shinii TaxID=2912228 RepID=UPI00298F0AA0|nr:cupin domain-containing protein [Staphylococcus shinii]MDW8569966.1 cupin domain-containing protein [Staphylococcus shinii]MDW8574131.1 cupin domain-containing protein [Staphylococcus shinii]